MKICLKLLVSVCLVLLALRWEPLSAEMPRQPVVNNDVEAMIATARALPVENPEKERLYRSALKRAPADPRILFNLALLLQAKGNYTQATQLYHKLLAIKPGDAVAHYNLANVLLARNDQALWQQAAWHLRQCLFYSDDKLRSRKSRQLLNSLERNLATLYAGYRQRHYSASELQAMLLRVLPDDAVRGASRYDGPRVPLMLNFATQSAMLTPAAKQQLDEVAVVLKIPALRADRIQIEGYTDSHEYPDFQQRQRCARLRAQRVRDYLVATHHLKPERFTIKAFADLEIISANNTPKGRAQNRRVELYNLGKGRKLSAPLHH